MIRIEPYLLWLGHSGDCRDVAAVLDAEIRAVLQLAIEEPAAAFPRDVIALRIPLHDGADNLASDLRLAVDTAARLLSTSTPTLICCGAGMSRSPAIAACAIARLEGISPPESLQRIHIQHGIDVSPALWRDLISCLS